MKQTLEKKKTLWLYNCGRDRYSFGFYNWKWDSNGRWEWEFQNAPNGATGNYPGREWFNPFTERHATTNLGPLNKNGGLLYQATYFHMAEGINDYAYVYTLQNVLKTATGAKADEAKDFLAALKRAMPDFPQIKGLASAADGPKVGMGMEGDSRLQCDAWRGKIVQYLKDLKKQ
jgi:hypothetical protein